jgi:hypothetical protein
MIDELRDECSALQRRLQTTSNALLQQSSGGLSLDGRSASGSQPQPPPSKWQVQNRVGGGSLYGVADNAGGRGGRPPSGGGPFDRRGSGAGGGERGFGRISSTDSLGGSSVSGAAAAVRFTEELSPSKPAHPASAATAGAAAAPEGRRMEGVDIVYLKNVLLKFMEAAMTGKVQEREVLLPAVAALLQVRWIPWG